MNKRMGHWWNDTDKGNRTYFERNLSQYYRFEGTSHMDWPGIELRAITFHFSNVTAYII